MIKRLERNSLAYRCTVVEGEFHRLIWKELPVREGASPTGNPDDELLEGITMDWN